MVQPRRNVAVRSPRTPTSRIWWKTGLMSPHASTLRHREVSEHEDVAAVSLSRCGPFLSQTLSKCRSDVSTKDVITQYRCCKVAVLTANSCPVLVLLVGGGPSSPLSPQALPAGAPHLCLGSRASPRFRVPPPQGVRLFPGPGGLRPRGQQLSPLCFCFLRQAVKGTKGNSDVGPALGQEQTVCIRRHGRCLALVAWETLRRGPQSCSASAHGQAG